MQHFSRSPASDTLIRDNRRIVPCAPNAPLPATVALAKRTDNADPVSTFVGIVAEDDDEPDADGLILARIEAEAAELADAIEAGDCDAEGNWRPYDRSYWPGHL